MLHIWAVSQILWKCFNFQAKLKCELLKGDGIAFEPDSYNSIKISKCLLKSRSIFTLRALPFIHLNHWIFTCFVVVVVAIIQQLYFLWSSSIFLVYYSFFIWTNLALQKELNLLGKHVVIEWLVLLLGGNKVFGLWIHLRENHMTQRKTRVDYSLFMLISGICFCKLKKMPPSSPFLILYYIDSRREGNQCSLLSLPFFLSKSQCLMPTRPHKKNMNKQQSKEIP